VDLKQKKKKSGEGSFSISVRDIDKDTKKARVLYVFSIILHKKDHDILRSIQSTLGIGKIYKHGKEGVQYRVESKKELLILIEHFDKYPLTTKKGKDFLCFVFFFRRNFYEITRKKKEKKVFP
jgi:hypothetical protein